MSRNIKYTCGVSLPSACVFFTGDFPSFISEDAVSCDANLDEILSKYGVEVEKLIDTTDLSALNKGSYVFTSGKVKDFAQETVEKVSELEALLTSLQTSIQTLNVGAQLVTVDLKCLKPVASPCEVSGDTYSMLSVLNILVNEICLIKSHLNL